MFEVGGGGGSGGWRRAGGGGFGDLEGEGSFGGRDFGEFGSNGGGGIAGGVDDEDPRLDGGVGEFGGDEFGCGPVAEGGEMDAVGGEFLLADVVHDSAGVFIKVDEEDAFLFGDFLHGGGVGGEVFVAAFDIGSGEAVVFVGDGRDEDDAGAAFAVVMLALVGGEEGFEVFFEGGDAGLAGEGFAHPEASDDEVGLLFGEGGGFGGEIGGAVALGEGVASPAEVAQGDVGVLLEEGFEVAVDAQLVREGVADDGDVVALLEDGFGVGRSGEQGGADQEEKGFHAYFSEWHRERKARVFLPKGRTCLSTLSGGGLRRRSGRRKGKAPKVMRSESVFSSFLSGWGLSSQNRGRTG